MQHSSNCGISSTDASGYESECQEAHVAQLEDLGDLVGDVHHRALLLRADVVDLADLALQPKETLEPTRLSGLSSEFSRWRP